MTIAPHTAQMPEDCPTGITSWLQMFLDRLRRASWASNSRTAVMGLAVAMGFLQKASPQRSHAVGIGLWMLVDGYVG
jgi:hypothetical protein